MKRLTLKAVNEAVKKAGMNDVTLYQGRGYLYFFGDGVVNQSHSVMVCRLNHLTLDHWIQEAIEATTQPTLEWMLSSRSRTSGEEAAVRSLRDAHQAAKKAVEEWAAKGEGGREVIASAILERLGECATDTDGDDTLDVVSELLEELWKKMSNHLAHALGDLAKAAHAVGQVRSIRGER